jgi:ribosomal protein S19
MKDYKYQTLFYKFFRSNFGKKPIYARNGLIDFTIVGQKFSVYNGNGFRSITPKEEFVHTPIGHYSFTTITGSSIHKRKRKKKEKKKRGRKLFKFLL